MAMVKNTNSTTGDQVTINTYGITVSGGSTLNSNEDGRDPSLSRSIAWATTTQPLYKQVNPQAVFDTLVASGARDATGAAPAIDTAAAERRKQLKLSALDFVLESASSLSKQLGREDKPKLERFLSSVRELDSVAQTARRAGASIADRGDRDVTLRGEM